MEPGRAARIFIGRYDGPAALFYLDPPYGEGVFRRSDFNRLAERLGAIAGRFILSVNDVPGTRLAFKEFIIEPVTTCYTLAGGAGIEATEILLMGPGADPDSFPRSRDLLSL